MKIFLCGQRTFGKEVCRALLAAGHEIVGVAPAPPQKRKDKLHGFAAVQGLPLVTDCKSLVSSFIPDGTELIVAATLEPHVYDGPAEGLPRGQWRLRSPDALLSLKVCDMSMGSGAVRVQACRYLAERLLEGAQV